MPTSRNVPVTTVNLEDQEVSTFENVTGEFSDIVDIQVPKGYRYEFVPTQTLEMFIPTHESVTVTTDSGTETVNLSNNLVNSPSVRDVETSSSNAAVSGPRSLTVWDDQSDIQSGVESVDYDANSFDYVTPDATDRDLEVYYLWGDQAQVELRHYTPAEEDYDKELIKSMRSFHAADVYSHDGAITFPEPFTLMEKEHLKVTVKTDVDLTNWDAHAGDGSSDTPGDFETHGHPRVSIPVRRVPMKS